jgi:hypothetical protein
VSDFSINHIDRDTVCETLPGRPFEEAIIALRDAAQIFQMTGDQHREAFVLRHIKALRNAQSSTGKP